MSLVNLQADKVYPLRMEMPQVVFSSIVDSLMAMFLTLHTCCKLKSFNYKTVTIEFVNCLPTNFNSDILKLLHFRHPWGHFGQLQGIDKKFDAHV
jgi:hypothetical protein